MGRKPGYVVGIDIGGTNFRIGMVAEDRQLSNFVIESTDILYKNDSQLENLITYIREYTGRYSSGTLEAISIGFPSTVSRDKKTVYSSPNIKGFDNMNVADPVAEAFSVPVFIENDVTFLLQYEISEKNLEDRGIVLGFYIGTGFGNAVYINGSFLDGKNGVAAELGHVPVPGGTGECGCGNKGCIEMYASGKKLMEIKEKHFPDTGINEIFTRHGQSPVIQEFIEMLSIPVATEINIFDPDYVIIGGGVVDMPGFPREELEKHIYGHARKPFPAENLNILYSESGQEAGVLGAAYFGLEKIKKDNEGLGRKTGIAGALDSGDTEASKGKIKIAPSIMCADFLHLEEDIHKLEQAGADLFHIDIMDGHFVPNLSLNFDIIRILKGISKTPVDVHLMVDDSESYIDRLHELGVEYVSFHIEAVKYPIRLLKYIKELGMKAGIAINPSTPEENVLYLLEDADFILIMSVEPGFAGQKFIPGVLKKIECIKGHASRLNPSLEIEVDGNISPETAEWCIKRGANILVAGTSSIFKKDADLYSAFIEFREGTRKI